MGYDSLKAIGGDEDSYLAKQVLDVRLRMDGLFELEEHAVQFVEEFIALYTNGPAGGGGIRYWQLIAMLLLCWQANLLYWSIVVQYRTNMHVQTAEVCFINYMDVCPV